MCPGNRYSKRDSFTKPRRLMLNTGLVKKKFTHQLPYEIKNMWPIFKNQMLIYQLKAIVLFGLFSICFEWACQDF